jgi:hypothetical protein
MARPVVSMLCTATGPIIRGDQDAYAMPKEETQPSATGSDADIEALRLAIQRRFTALGLPLPARPQQQDARSPGSLARGKRGGHL